MESFLTNYHNNKNEHLILNEFDILKKPTTTNKYQINFLITKKNDIIK